MAAVFGYSFSFLYCHAHWIPAYAGMTSGMGAMDILKYMVYLLHRLDICHVQNENHFKTSSLTNTNPLLLPNPLVEITQKGQT